MKVVKPIEAQFLSISLALDHPFACWVKYRLECKVLREQGLVMFGSHDLPALLILLISLLIVKELL